MRVLYAALRHDPTDLCAGSGVDHFCYRSLVDAGFETRICGPFLSPSSLPERAIRRIYESWTHKRYAKFHISKAWRASRVLTQMEHAWGPDVAFTIFPAPLAFYTGRSPCIYDQDVSFISSERNYPQFGTLAFRLCLWLERKAFAKCAHIITHSEDARRVLVTDYGIGHERISMFPYPPMLGKDVPVGSVQFVKMKLSCPLQLLLVGRDYRRKGIDIAIGVVRELNDGGVPAELTVCGCAGENREHVRFVGSYSKSDRAQRDEYLALYRQAHLLLHPALFDPSPLVPSEAAAFGVPTLTNNTGGLATTVADGVSGIVLPKGSPPHAYVAEIKALVGEPERYHHLCVTTRERYERELCFEVASRKLAAIVRQVAESAENHGRDDPVICPTKSDSQQMSL